MVAPYSWYESLVMAYSWKRFYENENGRAHATRNKGDTGQSRCPRVGCGHLSPALREKRVLDESVERIHTHARVRV